MVHKRTKEGWEGIPAQQYKDQPGTWMGVSRFTFEPLASTDFEMRYFEIEPEGYTSLEEHEHEHCVFVISGHGEVWLDQIWQPIAVSDFVYVAPWQKHQFRNSGNVPFGFVCVVDRVRDRPQVSSSCDLPDPSRI